MFTFNFYLIVCSLSVLVLRVPFVENFKLGDQCSFKDGSRGICKFLTDCPFALDSLDQGVFPENTCEYEDTESVFCCKEKGTEVSTSTTTTSTTAATTTSSTSASTSSSPTAATSTTPSTTTQATTSSSQIPSTAGPTSTTTSPRIGTRGKRKPGEISKIKCEEYAQYVYDDSETYELVLQPHIAHTFECAFEKLPLIVGGTLASRQEFPHMALVGYQAEDKAIWDCGGSLISENFVLTAAHCISHRQAGPAKFVKLGLTNQSDTNHLQQYTISEIIPHPEYVNKTKYHDIALLKLSGKAKLNTYVHPGCLHTQKDIPLKRAIASGWGNIGFTDRGSNDLLKVVLEFFPPEKCNRTYRRYTTGKKAYLSRGIVDDIMVCAGSSQDNKNTCQGDSGGPLQIYHEDTPDIMCMYDILGITSFGKSCGLAKDVPGVFTRVSGYIEWIESIVWPE